MATRTFEQLPDFHPESESISVYVECADLFFTANGIPNEKKVSVFLMVIGAVPQPALAGAATDQDVWAPSGDLETTLWV